MPPPPALLASATPGGSQSDRVKEAPAPPPAPPMALPPAPPLIVAVTVQPEAGAKYFCPLRAVMEKAPTGRVTPGLVVEEGVRDRVLERVLVADPELERVLVADPVRVPLRDLEGVPVGD